MALNIGEAWMTRRTPTRLDSLTLAGEREQRGIIDRDTIDSGAADRHAADRRVIDRRAVDRGTDDGTSRRDRLSW
jgi:hypothetical protein